MGKKIEPLIDVQGVIHHNYQEIAKINLIFDSFLENEWFQVLI